MENSFRRSGKYTKICLAAIVISVLLTILQDRLRSVISHSGFYLSESLLFSSFWWLFIPILSVQYIYVTRAKKLTVSCIVLLLLLPVVLHILAFPVVVWVLSGLFYYHTFAMQQTIQYTLSEHLYLLLLFYSIPFLYYRMRNKLPAKPTFQPVVPEAPQKPISSLMVTEGSRHMHISTEDILYLTANTPYINIHLGQKKYLFSETLRSIAQKLDSELFIRIHKSAIVNKRHIQFYTSRLNGDYDITMTNNETLRLSRNYVADFKMKWSGTPQVTSK